MTDIELKRYMNEGIEEVKAREIEKMVYLSFPKTKKEKECRTEKNNRDELREVRRKRLIAETKEKREIKYQLTEDGSKLYSEVKKWTGIN